MEGGNAKPNTTDKYGMFGNSELKIITIKSTVRKQLKLTSKAKP